MRKNMTKDFAKWTINILKIMSKPEVNFISIYLRGKIKDNICSTSHVSLSILSQIVYLGLSENSVPLNPMVNDHYPY